MDNLEKLTYRKILTEKQLNVLNDFCQNEGSSGFNRTQYQHLVVIKKRCLHVIKNYEAAKDILVLLLEHGKRKET